ncbi:MAG: hypothetical protein M1819_003206 [Sarea resinae]|nr:MAG: hypothetical protein M1819_003206 [Sarea resinae]
MTTYVTGGAGVNVPSENMGFYFSGMRRADWGEIRVQGRPEYNATTIANSFISVNMSVMRHEQWSNVTLPSNIPGRANAELVWVPVSEQGILLAIGGVVDPESYYLMEDSQQITQSENESPGFIKEIAIYDIASQNWYLQNTTGDYPPQLTRACSILASANDSSSHNVYFYGGYDGLNSSSDPSDDVYILSVPSFTWLKAYTGNSTHGRDSHKCAKVYPDQMFVVGGVPQEANSYQCLSNNIVQIFNLNTLEFQDSYDPDVWSEYKVPDIVTKRIGGK